MEKRASGKTKEVHLDLISPFVAERRKTVTLANSGSSLVPSPKPDLNLHDGQEVTVNGRNVPIPLGVGRKVTAETIKVLAGIYRGMILFISSSKGWRRLGDKEEVDLKDRRSNKPDDPPLEFLAQPPLTRD